MVLGKLLGGDAIKTVAGVIDDLSLKDSNIYSPFLTYKFNPSERIRRLECTCSPRERGH